MKQATHKILLSADEKGRWEYPRKFHWDKRMNLIRDLKIRFEDIFGFKLDLDWFVQDASFTTDLGLLDDKSYNRETKTGALTYIFSFRFSNFGNLFTIINKPNQDSQLFHCIRDCQKILQESKFIYVPADELDEIYDGINKPYEEELTWMTRYFDYL